MLPIPTRTRVRSLFLPILGVLAACGGDSSPDEADTSVSATVFENARVIVGDGSVLDDAMIVVLDGRFAYVGPTEGADMVEGAERIDLTGRTVMPAVVNAHVHLAPEREARTEQLQHMAYYGTGTAISLGLDEGDAAFAMRDEVVPMGARSLTAGRGITSPEPGRSEVPYWVTTEEEARDAVRELAGQEVDFVKIWVDDRGGQYERLSPPLYGAVIDEAHENGLRVTAHVFTLEDAKGLLRAGIDAFAHGIRDQDVDEEVVALWQERPEVVLVPNLPGPGVSTDVSWLAGTVPAEELAAMQESASRENPSAQEAFGIQARNLVRLSEAGVLVAFGTDGSAPWAIHQEMEDMVRAGMAPADVLVAATSRSAELLELDDTGQVMAGLSADFVILEADPLVDITNTRRIADVYLRGERVDREALSAHFLAGGS